MSTKDGPHNAARYFCTMSYIYKYRKKATTWSLVGDVIAATYIAARNIAWPVGLHRHLAAEITHAQAAELNYAAEVGTQTIRLPWVSLDDASVDCKSTAVFIGSMCRAAGRSVSLRFVQYSNGPTHWEHVYAIVDGRPVDPLLPIGQEYPYIRCFNYEL